MDTAQKQFTAGKHTVNEGDVISLDGATGEVFLREAQSGSVEIKEGAIESVIARGERGIGVRVLDDQRLGFAYTSDLSAEGILKLKN